MGYYLFSVKDDENEKCVCMDQSISNALLKSQSFEWLVKKLSNSTKKNEISKWISHF